MSRKQMALFGFLGFVGLAMLTGAVAILFPRRIVSDRILGSLVLIGLYALGIMLVMTFGGRMRWVRRGCVAGFVVSLILFLVGIWFERVLEWRWENYIWVSGAIALTIGSCFSHLLFIWPIKPTQLSSSAIRWAALLMGLFTAGVVLVGFVQEGFGYWGRMHIRIMGMSAIVTAGTTIATIAIAMFAPKPGEDEPGLIGSAIQVSMTCPRCGSATKAVADRESRCTGCRLKIRVEVEEPRCACGYSLYQLESNVCPECGRSVADEDRWVKTLAVDSDC